MIEILIALIAVTGMSVWGCTRGGYSIFVEVICPLVSCFAFLGLLLYAVLAWGYFSAGYKAEIINREFGTNYTQEEVFYAQDVIDTIREIQRQRVEINGDLITGE